MPLRFLLDENVESERLRRLLKKAGHDVVWLQELLPKGTPDNEVIAIAKQNNRIIYSRDRDFLGLANQIEHAGIIFEYVTSTPKDMTIAEIIKALAAIEKLFPNLENILLVVNAFRQTKSPPPE